MPPSVTIAESIKVEIGKSSEQVSFAAVAAEKSAVHCS